MDRALSALRRRCPLVLIGTAGIGKTSLARHVIQTAGHDAFWVIGSESTRTTPLAAVATSVEVEGTGDTAAILRTIRSRVSATNAVLVVEAAEYLDSASVAVLAQLIEHPTGAGQIICLRSRSSEIGSPLISALQQTHACEIDLPPLTLDETRAVVDRFLQTSLDLADAVRLQQVSGGNPFYLRQLVVGAHSTNRFRRGSDGRTRLAAHPATADGLDAALVSVLASADPDDVRLMDYLAVLSPLPARVTTLLGLGRVVDTALGDPRDRSQRMVTVVGDSVYPTHEIFAEHARRRLGQLRRHQVTAELVDALGCTDQSAVVGLHRVRLALGIDRRLPPDEIIHAANTAFSFGDLWLAEHLSRAAVDQGGGLAAVLQLVRAVGTQGRADEAIALIENIDVDSLSEADLVGYLLSASITLSVGMGRHREALDLIETHGSRCEKPLHRCSLDAMRANAFLNAGMQADALRAARRVQAEAEGNVLWESLAGFIEAEVLRRLGENNRPLALADRSLTSSMAVGPLVGMGARRCLVQASIAAGTLDNAGARAEEMLEHAVLQHVPRAVASSTNAVVAAYRGDLDKAAECALDALDALPSRDRTGLGRGTAATLAMIRAMQGDVDGAKVAARRCRDSTNVETGWDGANVILCDGFVAAAQGMVVKPAAAFHNAGVRAMAVGQLTEGIHALYWSMRFGDKRSAELLSRPQYRCEGALFSLMAMHADRWLRNEPTQLIDVAREFRSLGFIPFAADAMAHAVSAFRQRGSPRDAALAHAELRAVLAECDGVVTTPAITCANSGAVLTQRETEIHAIRGSGLALAEMAELMGIKSSTVRRYVEQLRHKVGPAERADVGDMHSPATQQL